MAKQRKKKINVKVMALFLAAVVFVAAFVTFWGVGSNGFAQNNPVHFFNDWGKGEISNARTVAVTSDGKKLIAGGKYTMPAGFTFLSARSSSPTYAKSGEITLTASLSNEYINGAFDWSASFANSNDSTSGFISVTPVADGAPQAVVKFLEKFNEQIILTATLRDDADVSAACTVDCLKDVSISTPALGASDFGDNLDFETHVTWGDGTVQGDVVLKKANLSITSDFITAFKQRLKFDVSVKSFTFDVTNSQTSLNNNWLWTYTGNVLGYSHFINGFNDYDDEHKNAIYWAWYNAFQKLGDDNVLIDVTYMYQFSGIDVETLVENDFACGPLYGEAYGQDVEISATLNNNVVF